jgi:predicted TIM-barrel fold metal-dependent hydrolase
MNIQGTHTRANIMGKLLDCDAHLYMEPEVMADIVSEVGGGFVVDFLRKFAGSPQDVEARSRNRTDVLGVKGISALGSCDPQGRIDAMDSTGVQAQLVFPNTALLELRLPTDAARKACLRYNDYALDWTRNTGGRGRAVCQINMADPAWALKELDRVLDKGARGVLMPCATPPGGVSPANDIWDPFWERLQAAEVPALLHIGTGGILSSEPPDPMLPPREFASAKGLRLSFDGRAGGEEAIGPFFILVAHIAPEVWLMSMVMGGVFERFPKLALGIIEVGAGWLGPLCERMDAHVELMAKVGRTYPKKPSEYVRQNVRVTPMWSEDLVKMIDRYGLEEAYVFSSDYPHLEGSRDPVGKFRKWTDRLPESYEQKFFVENAGILFSNP